MDAVVNRAGPNALALETTLLVHGVPRSEGASLAEELARLVVKHGASPALVGIHAGVPIVGMTGAELKDLLSAERVAKANTANLGVVMHAKAHGATTVAATMELASRAGVKVFATGGLGGVHHDYAHHLDVSADLAAFTRHPIAVVCSGVKGLLDVASTRELLETLGIPVVGYRTDRFPAFYRRDLGRDGPGVDVRFDEVSEVAAFVRGELARTGRGVVVANPIPAAEELPERELDAWVARATTEAQSRGVQGRAITPFVLSELHRISGGATLGANLALVRSNVELGARLAAGLASG